VSSLCNCPGIELDVADKWLKTPLHYACQRGASVCAVYLLNRHVDHEKKDIYGNTPLGIALQQGHFSFAITMIERHLDVKAMVFREDPEKIKKMWAL